MSNKKLKKESKFAYAIILLSISLILSYIESIFHISIGNIGMRIGFTNIVSIISLHILDTKLTLIINVLRILIIGILFGNLVRFTLSLSGFLCSFTVLYLFFVCFCFSDITSSIFAAVTHNVAQILTLSLIIKNTFILSLIPVYIIIGIVAGTFIGIASKMIYKAIITNIQ